MVAASDKLKFIPLATVTGVNIVALVAFVSSPFAHVYPMAILGIVAFTLVQLFLPACWPNLESPICPGNIAQLFFWVQLVVVPVLIGYFGPSLGTLPRLPAGDFIDFAIGLRVLGYVSFCIVFQVFVSSKKAHTNPRTPESVDAASGETFALIAAFAGIGLVGWLLHYGGIGGFIEYASSPAEQRLREQELATLAGAAGNILRHFLGFAVVWVWSVWVLRHNRTESGMVIAIATAAVAIILLLANFSYNRGTMVAPLLALTAAYSNHVRHISFTVAVFAGSILLLGAFAFGGYRSTDLQISDVSIADLTSFGDQQGLVDTIQVYASGPQMTAFMLEGVDNNSNTLRSGTIIPSILYPIPVVGKPFREMSGGVLFNQLIYSDADVMDQNIPYDAEFYLNFQAVGVILGYLLLGLLQAFLQTRFLHARQPITSYAWLSIGIWTMFPGSLPVLSQICVYSFWPIYAFAFIHILRYEQAIFEAEAKERGPVL